MKATLTNNGAIVLPSKLRRQDRIRAGEQFEIERLAAGQYLLKKQSQPDDPKDNAGFVDWLLACPEKGWFQPIPSESTDTLFKQPLFADESLPRRKPKSGSKRKVRSPS